MAHHKRKRPKHRRAGCLLCKPNKLTANKTADRAKARREWRRREDRVSRPLSQNRDTTSPTPAQRPAGDQRGVVLHGA